MMMIALEYSAIVIGLFEKVNFLVVTRLSAAKIAPNRGIME